MGSWTGRLPLSCPVCGSAGAPAEWATKRMQAHFVVAHPELRVTVTPTLPFEAARVGYDVGGDVNFIRIVWHDWPLEVETLMRARYEIREVRP